MTAVAVVANLAMGITYLAIGAVVLSELIRDRGEGDRLGLALFAMAVTCGPHHVEHGLHLLDDGYATAGLLDTVAVIVGLPAGGIYAWLVLERIRGGAGDRMVPGTPRWLAALALSLAAYGILATGAIIDRLASLSAWDTVMVPNLLLVGIYLAVGVVILRTQLVRRPLDGSWSLAGLSLGMVFPTCAVMHASWVLYGALGVYQGDAHLLVIDWLSVPAGLYFLWVVADLRRSAVGAWQQEVLGSAEHAT